MIKQLSFIHDGKRYTTLFGADEYLATALEPNSNVVECGKILASGGFNTSFKRTFGMQVRDVPIIQNPVVQRNGNIYVVVGTALIDGEERNVKITALGVEIDMPEEVVEETVTEETEETPTVVEETVVEETPTAVEETEKVEETLTEENSIEEVEETPEEPVVEETTEEPVAEEHAVEDFMPEPVVEDFMPEPVKEPEVIPPKPAVSDFMNPPVVDKSNVKGLVFGDVAKDYVEGLTPGLVIGGSSNNSNSLLFGGTMYTRNVHTGPRTFADVMLKRSTSRTMNNSIVQKMNVKEERKEMVLGKPAESDKIEEVQELVEETEVFVTEECNPVNVEVPVKEAVEVDRETLEKTEEIKTTETDSDAKKALRARFSKEVNDVIGKIPLEILSPIAEFTLTSVDMNRLESQGELYCVEKRWRKCGKWFCVDVVNEATRHFYNSKLGINIAIPFSDCKEWLSAISNK